MTFAWATIRRPLPLLALVAACGGGTDIITPAPPPPTGVAFTLTADPEDATTAQALDWQGGIPGATITLTPADSSAAARTATTSAAGGVLFTDLPPGKYIAESARWLSAAERGRLPAGDDAIGFVDRGAVQISSASGNVARTAPASRRKSLVISEWAFNAYVANGFGAYFHGGFIELHNNADTTVYLDGMIVAEGFPNDIDVPSNPCNANLDVTADPEGVWSRFAQQFPGTGRTYPVSPGGTIVVATDAIDHRPLFPGAIDLSTANFEFFGQPDVDNPSAPNLMDFFKSHDHGIYFPFLAAVPVVTLPLDIGSLKTIRKFSTNTLYYQLPRSKILDVLWVRSNFQDPDHLECPRQVHPNFDREGSAARGTDEQLESSFSLSRRRTPVGPVLQHTRSGAADWVRTPLTPGVVP